MSRQCTGGFYELAGDRRVRIFATEDFGGATDAGPVMQVNEDAIFVDRETSLFVVADGLGGHAGGATAAKITVDCARHLVFDRKATMLADPIALMHLIVTQADRAITRHARQDPGLRQMGAALVAALVQGRELFVAHAGDARAYLRRGDALTRLTVDHTAVGDLLRAGLIDEEQARLHPGRHTIHKVVGGGKQPPLPDVARQLLAPDDCVLLCTDGLWAELPAAQIGATLGEPLPAGRLAESLINQALAAGGRDNVSAIVYRHKPAP